VRPHCRRIRPELTTARLYLILDYSDPDRTARFLASAHLPSPYVHAIRGYHALDRSDFSSAVAELAAAGDENDLLPRCIERLAVSPAHLVAFARLAQPRVTRPENIAALVVAFVSQGDIVEAWRWARQWPTSSEEPPTRMDAVKLVLDTAFGATDEPIAAAVETLVSFPFEGEGEDEAVWAYVASPPETLSAASKDLLASWAVMRLSAEGRCAAWLRML
jgi:hypothetical protein